MKNIFLLDLDETLLDFSKGERENLTTSLSHFSLPADDSVIALFHKINDGLWKALERGEVERERLKVLRFEMLFEQLGIPVPAQTAQEISAYYFHNFPNICYPYEGSVDFLKTLAARGKTYIVTNGAAEIQYRHINDAGFAPFLSGVFISREIGYDKPDLRFARYAEEHIEGYERSRAIWLGDSITSDMACARVAGIDHVLFAPKGAPAGYSGAVVRNYEEFLELISK
ncbi:MAG: HAD hydrolase-like protein [Clostridia bacterium]|nr:HAD hydrolase-like protein [Clostridia bacterium]